MDFDEIFPKGDNLPGNPGYFDPDRKKNYVVICLDRSGSMQSIKQQAIEFFNAQVVEAKNASKDMDNHMCLITFNDKIDIVDWDVDANDVKLLDAESYHPQDWTAMLDAVGKGVTKLKEQADINDENVAVLFTVISDGLENASKEYSYEAISKLINEMTETKRWTFTYLGSNQDLSQIRKMGISEGNIRAFTASPEGVAEINSMHSVSSSNYYFGRSAGMTMTSSFYGGGDNSLLGGAVGSKPEKVRPKKKTQS